MHGVNFLVRVLFSVADRLHVNARYIYGRRVCVNRIAAAQPASLSAAAAALVIGSYSSRKTCTIDEFESAKLRIFIEEQERAERRAAGVHAVDAEAVAACVLNVAPLSECE